MADGVGRRATPSGSGEDSSAHRERRIPAGFLHPTSCARTASAPPCQPWRRRAHEAPNLRGYHPATRAGPNALRVLARFEGAMVASCGSPVRRRWGRTPQARQPAASAPARELTHPDWVSGGPGRAQLGGQRTDPPEANATYSGAAWLSSIPSRKPAPTSGVAAATAGTNELRCLPKRAPLLRP